MSVVIAEKAGRAVLLVRPSSATSTRTPTCCVVNPSATIVTAVLTWLPSSTGRRPSRSASTPPPRLAPTLPSP
jgi:hypothetical protein